MANATLENILRRDRAIVTVTLAILIVLAWSYVLWLAADMDMGGMDMSGFRMIPAGNGLMKPATAPWSAIEFEFVLAMWAVMMVGMMTPSATPVILLYARVGGQAAGTARTLAATWWFASGYLLVWTAFSFAATLAQWALERESSAHPGDGRLKRGVRRHRHDRNRPLSVDAAQGRLPSAMQGAVVVHSAPWRLSR